MRGTDTKVHRKEGRGVENELIKYTACIMYEDFLGGCERLEASAVRCASERSFCVQGAGALEG